MRLFAAMPAICLFVLFACLHSVVAQNLLHKCGGLAPAQYIIGLKREVNMAAFIQKAGITPTEQFDFINSFSVKLSQNQINTLCNDPTGQILSITGPSIAYPDAPLGHIPNGMVTQNDATWGLHRLKVQKRIPSTLGGKVLDSQLDFLHDAEAGKGVDIYIVDTGVFVKHSDFGDRARWGGSFATGDKEKDKLDTNDIAPKGHGTHVAGTAAGTRWGVAKSANIIAVKVFRTKEFTTDGTAVVRGLQFIYDEYRKSKRRSVVNMSFGFKSVVPAVDQAIKKLVDSGIHVVVSAGNNGKYMVESFTPSYLPYVITVGATTVSDRREVSSNWGPAIDIWAPGSGIWSAALDDPKKPRESRMRSQAKTGTSMAAPHVTGIIATLLSRRETMHLGPAEMAAEIKKLALRDVLQFPGIPDDQFKRTNLLARLPDKVMGSK